VAVQLGLVRLVHEGDAAFADLGGDGVGPERAAGFEGQEIVLNGRSIN
jgi:hypothetical protein